MADQKELIATVLQNTAVPQSIPVNGETAGILSLGVSMAVGAILYLRRKTSRDGLEMLKDRTEGMMLKNAQDERDKAMKEAREAWNKANADARLIGELTAENAYLKREMLEVRDQINEIRHGVQSVGQKVDATKLGIDKAEKKISESGMSPLGEN